LYRLSNSSPIQEKSNCTHYLLPIPVPAWTHGRSAGR
jgi:hypothetical protein